MTTIWTEWLPDPIYTEVREEEPKRFAALVAELKETWTATRHKPWPDSLDAVLRRFPLLFQFMQTPSNYGIDVVETLIRVALEIVFAAQCDATVLVRFADAVSHYLRTYKSEWKGRLTLEWRPFYDLCLKLFVEDRFVYCGDDALMSIRQSVFCLVCNCSKYFEEDAILEIWETLKPSITNVQNGESFIALGWLSILLPAHDLSPKVKNWNDLVVEWLGWMESVSLCDYWLTHWFDIFARLAKYDTQGLIAWQDHASRLCTAFLCCFDLPIGTATGEMKYSKVAVPRRAEMWFPLHVLPMERSAAKCLIFLLRNDATNETVMPYVTKMIDLLEQFCHPSNGGEWTTMLAVFLKHLVKQLMKVISSQDISGETKAHLTIPKNVRRSFVEHVLKMAFRGQFSKKKEMRSNACQAFCQLAYLEPDLVLPLVYNRFMGAIGSPHAPTTLGASAHAFALCVRPMLMHGLPLPDMDPHEAASQAIAQAMMDVLPGLDANDPSKTGTIFRFYAAVLFNLPTLDPQSPIKGRVLPLDVEIWAEEFLSRIFVLLENMEGPEARTDQSHTTETTATTGTFLSKDVVFFDWCLEAFLLKLPASLQLRAVKRVAAFLLSSPLPRSSQECESLCSALMDTNREATTHHLAIPLLEALLDELPPSKGDGQNDFTFTHFLTTKICWNLRLLGTILDDGRDIAQQRMHDVCEVMDRALGVTNREIQDIGGAWFMKMVMGGLLCHHPILTNDILSEHVLPSGILKWVSKKPENWNKAQWKAPTKRDIDAASTLVERYLTQSITNLEDLMEKGVKDDRIEDQCNALLNKIRGVLSGAEGFLADFEMPETMKTQRNNCPHVVPFSIAGAVWARVGKPGTREALCKMLIQLSHFLEDADPTILSNLLEVMDMALNVGSISPPDDFGSLADPDEDTTKAEMYFIEPAIAHSYFHGTDTKCLKRRPYVQALTRVWGQYTKRVEDAAYQQWYSNVHPSMVTADTVPYMMGQLMGPLFHFTIHPYEEVADLAQQAVEKVFRRYPILTSLYTPYILPSLTRLPIPEDISMETLVKDPQFEKNIFHQMENFMQSLDFDIHPHKGEETDLSVGALEDAAVKGAVMLMSTSFHAWSGLFRVPEKTARMIYAFMGSRKTNSSDAQAFLTYLVWKFLSRFVPPPYIKFGMDIPVVDEVRKQLCLVGKEGVLANWKFSLLANVYLIIMLPLDRTGSGEILEHFFEISVCSLPLLRRLGLRGIYAILRPITHQPISTDAPLALQVHKKLKDSGFVEKLVRVFVDDHETTGDDHSGGNIADQMRSIVANGSFEEILVTGSHTFIDRFDRWPAGETPKAISNGMFLRMHASTIHVRLDDERAREDQWYAWQSTFVDLSKRIGSQHDEKHELSALAELLAGVTASGAPFRADSTSGSSAWDLWFAKIFEETLGTCSLESATGAFSVAIRYAAHHLCESSNLDRIAFVKFVQLLLRYEEKTGTGQSTTELKKLSFLSNAFKDIDKVFKFDAMPLEFVPLYEAVIQLLTDWLVMSFQSVRKQMAVFIVRICSYLLSATSQLEDSRQQLASKAQDLLDTMVERFYDGLQHIQSANHGTDTSPHVGGNSSTGSMDVEMNGHTSTTPDLSVLQSKIGLAIQFVVAAMHNAQVRQLAPTLVRLLPGIFQIQELGDSRLKPLQMEAASCFSSLKYLTVDRELIETVVQSLKEAAQYRPWHARGAALVFLQVFWYHHCLILTQEQSHILQSIAVQLLEDEKLEVQNAACSTLSGMIKGMHEGEQRKLRHQFLANMRHHYPPGRRKQKSSTAFDIRQRHAGVLGLKAFVLAHPYDIPSWMAEVLVAMIPAAHDTNPIKTTVTKTLGDFRTTHENESHEELREAFDEETWENLQAVGSQASYFT